MDEPDVDERTQLGREIEVLIAHADDVARDDEGLFDRRLDLVRRAPGAVLDIGRDLVAGTDPARREMGAQLVGLAAQVDPRLREAALAVLRGVLAGDAASGPLSAAILQLGHLDDEGSHDGILAAAHHPDPVVRHVVAFALPRVGLDWPALAGLSRLTRDDDPDVRDWATFGLAELTDADGAELRDTLLARVEDPDDETRVHAIVGLCRRRDERVRPHLRRELAVPDHAEALDEAAGILDQDRGQHAPGRPPAWLN